MPASMRLNAAAFISPQNHPILVRNFTSTKQDDLKYHYVAHTSLDVIEERRAILTTSLRCS
jgi:trafficking protein particle complex subunit 2